jgi:hypothetical protein
MRAELQKLIDKAGGVKGVTIWEQGFFPTGNDFDSLRMQ